MIPPNDKCLYRTLPQASKLQDEGLDLEKHRDELRVLKASHEAALR